MRKLLLSAVCLLMLAGCTGKKEESETPVEASAEQAAETVEEIAQEAEPVEAQEEETQQVETIEYERIEGYVEKNLPQTLEVTIQDMVVMFTKDIAYECDDELTVGAEVVLYYTGNLEDHPILHKAELK